MSRIGDSQARPLVRRALLTVCGVILLAALFYPFESAAVPEWTVRVLDAEGRPMGGMGVRETWQNYSLEGRGHSTDLSTDAQGVVTFPPQSVKAPLIKRALYPLINLRQGVHSSSGVHASVIVLLPDPTEGIGSEHWEPGRPLPETIAVQPLK